jgi:Ribbon-helix-helix protein, copG family
MDFIERAAEQQTPALSATEISSASKRRRKEPVIIRFDDYVLSKLDKAAAKRGLSRAALVRLLVMEHLPD